MEEDTFLSELGVTARGERDVARDVIRNAALAAARAFLSTGVDMTAQEVGEKSIAIAADICVYTNHTTVVETIPQTKDAEESEH